MASELQDQLKAAIQLAQQGQKDAARGLLLSIVERDPQQELAWMWLAVVSTNQDERLQYVERTLAINPANERALSAYTKLTGQTYEAPAPSAAPSFGYSANMSGTPPAPSDKPVDWTDTLKTRRSPLVTLGIIAMMVAIMLGGVYYFIGSMFKETNDTSGEASPIPSGLDLEGSGTPGMIFATDTPDVTPLPTITPGPSPTSLWENPEATWTPLPSPTIPPTRTPLPSYTPQPSATATPLESPTPRPTRTPLPTATPSSEADDQSTAESILTATPT